MDLARHVWKDLDDVGTLFERKLCRMGVVRLKLQRASTAFLFDHPAWSETLAQLAEQAEALEDRDASWLEGMVLVDRIRAVVKDPPAERRTTRLELVPDEGGDDLPAELDDAREAQPVDLPGEPSEAIPEDSAEPASPRLLPRRTL